MGAPWKAPLPDWTANTQSNRAAQNPPSQSNAHDQVLHPISGPSVSGIRRPAIDVKVAVQFLMRIDQAARLAIGSRDRWETGLRVVERT